MTPRPDTAHAGPQHPRRRARSKPGWLAVGVAVVPVALLAAACGSSAGSSAPATSSTTTSAHVSAAAPTTTTTTAAPTTTTSPKKAVPTTAPPTTAPPTTTAPTTTAPPAVSSPAVVLGPLTSPPLPAAGPGFVAGHVTAVGDSVMLDYKDVLEQYIPGITVDAAVSEQWSAGLAQLQSLKSAGQLGAIVVVGLGTNGPITSADFDNLMTILSGASRVVIVNTKVGQPWQDQVNAVLAAGVARYPNTVLADWESLVSQNPGWLYSDGTHLPIDGTGAHALAALVAGKV